MHRSLHFNISSADCYRSQINSTNLVKKKTNINDLLADSIVHQPVTRHPVSLKHRMLSLATHACVLYFQSSI